MNDQPLTLSNYSALANWIENLGNATATDVKQLIIHIQSTIEAGIYLEPEVRFLP